MECIDSLDKSPLWSGSTLHILSEFLVLHHIVYIMCLASCHPPGSILYMSPVKNAVAIPAPIGTPIRMQRRSNATTFLKGACTILFHELCFCIFFSPHGKFLLPILHFEIISSEKFSKESLADFRDSLRGANT